MTATALEVLKELHRLRIRVRAEGEQLLLDFPRGRMTPELAQRVRDNKVGLLALVSGNRQALTAAEEAVALLAGVKDAERRQDLQERFDERAGICEFEGSLPREEAERMALAELREAIGV